MTTAAHNANPLLYMWAAQLLWKNGMKFSSGVAWGFALMEFAIAFAQILGYLQ